MVGQGQSRDEVKLEVQLVIWFPFSDVAFKNLEEVTSHPRALGEESLPTTMLFCIVINFTVTGT